MIGVDITGLNILMEKIDYLNDDTKSKLKKMSSSINKLADSYLGSTIDNIYFVINKQCDTLNKIMPLHSSYLKTLRTVRDTYIFQDDVFSKNIEEDTRKMK